MEHITKALERCGYHKEGERTAISKMENQRKEGKQHREIQRYGHTSVCQRSNRICTADFKTQTLLHRLHQNSRRILVHPKENVEDSKKTDCVYQISCKTCNKTRFNKTRFAIQAKGPDGKWTRKPLAYRESNNVHLLITRPPEICVNLVFKHIHAASSYTICRQFVPFIYCPL